MTEDGQETKRIFCRICRGETHHSLRARYSRPRTLAADEVGPIDDVFAVRNSAEYKLISVGEIRTSIWSCNGCDDETFEWHWLPADDEGGSTSTYYPDRPLETSADLLSKKQFQKLDPKLDRLYSEIIKCFNADCPLLSNIGLRALIEGVCKDKGIADGNLERKVDGLIKFLPSVNLIEALHTFRFAGNSAAHDLEPTSRDDAREAIRLMEDLLNYLYDLDYRASQIRDASRWPALRLVQHRSVQ